jgi:transcriptional regulator with XRE-family HTH domain
MNNSKYKKLLERFRDKTYRHLMASQLVKRGLAEQIHEMRLDRGWTQAELAQASGKVQETISQLENPDYGNYTLKTLQRLAEAFDVALIVRFAPFSELAHWITDLSPEKLAVSNFDHDPGVHFEPCDADATGVNANKVLFRGNLFKERRKHAGVLIRSVTLNIPGNNVTSIEPYLKPTNGEHLVVKG